MKKLSLLGLTVFCLFLKSHACDLCSIYMNLEPNDLKNSFGVNYRYRLFESSSKIKGNKYNTEKHALGNTVINNSLSQKEQFRTTDLWLNYFLGSKVQLQTMISMSDNSYSENDSLLYNVSGLGDMNVIAKYLVYNSKSTDTSIFSMRLLCGGGIKIPTGNFNKSYTVTPFTEYKGNRVYGKPYQEVDPHMQAGTGSFDFLLTTEYLIRYKGLGFSTAYSYRINTTNRNRFRFANRFNSNNSFFYLLKLPKLTIAPNSGISFEFSERDRFDGKKYLNSGGSIIFQSYGLKLYIKKLAFEASYWSPLRHNLNDQQLRSNYRATVNLTYYF